MFTSSFHYQFDMQEFLDTDFKHFSAKRMIEDAGIKLDVRFEYINDLDILK